MNKVNHVNSGNMGYRPEIDGLRAIAVVSVILYHAKLIFFGKDWFEGGFIGVDIFFVISGYLITRIILSELQTKGSFSYLNFYERRARRILPALFVVIFVSIPFAWNGLLPSAFIEYAESILASLLFGSNFLFYFTTTEYGADSALLKPFLHTWSLGVEEQFYLAFPVLAIGAYKFFRERFLIILVGLSLSSIIFSQYMQVRNPDLNFYLPFSRFWELAAGSLLAYRELFSKPDKEGIFTEVAPLTGLLLIVYAIFFFDGATPHPTFWTLIPVTGVMLIIGFCSRHELIGRILGWKPFVWVGLISYSAYLWHFPLFAFLRVQGDATNYDKFGWIATTIALSIASYIFVEKPFRKDSFLTKRQFLGLGLTAFAVLFAWNASIIWNDGYTQRFDKLINTIELDNRKLQKDSWSLVLDRFNKNPEFFDVRRKVLIVGNSHSKDIFNALDQNKDLVVETDFLRYGNDANFQIACFDESISEFAKTIDAFYSSDLYAEATTLVVSTSWASNKRQCNKLRRDWPKASDFNGLENLIERTVRDGKAIVLMDQAPFFVVAEDEERTLVDVMTRDQDLIVDYSDISEFKMLLSSRMYESLDWKRQQVMHRHLEQIAEEYKVPLFSKISVTCNVEQKQCPGLTELNEKVFYDKSHYTLAGARLIGARLIEQQFHQLLK